MKRLITALAFILSVALTCIMFDAYDSNNATQALIYMFGYIIFAILNFITLFVLFLLIGFYLLSKSDL